MKTVLLAGISAIAMAALSAPAAAQEQFEVIHHFTADTESKALGILAEKFKEAGGTWVDNAVAGPPNARRLYTSRMQAGQPSAAYATVTSRDYLDFIEQGWLTDIEEVATANNWRDHFAPAVIESMTGPDGKIYMVPAALYAPNFVFYNKTLFDEHGIEEPVGFDETFFAALDKLKAAGVIPLAFSADAFHIRFPFEGILLQQGGPEFWQQVWGDRSEEAIRSDTMRGVFETLARLRDYTDEGATARPWNLSAAMVISGEAGMQIMGSWADGEYRAAGLTAGKEFGCFLPGERDYVQLHSDVFVFPKLPDQDGTTEQQKLFAQIAGDPVVQTEYVTPRGALPVRLDAAMPAHGDLCLQIAYEAVQGEGNLVPNPRSLIPQQMDGEYRDLVNEFWSVPEMTVDEVIDQLVEVLQAT